MNEICKETRGLSCCLDEKNADFDGRRHEERNPENHCWRLHILRRWKILHGGKYYAG